MAERNPFTDYLESHSDAGADTLKELFRALAKATHPDLGASDAGRFIRLQEHYHEAIGALLDRLEEPRPGGSRAAVLTALYRYKAHMPHLELDARDLPEACRAAFGASLAAARAYPGRAAGALAAFDEQFHRRRALNARYPEVRVKYSALIRGLSGFYDYQFLPNDFNRRVTRSFLAEIGPVTNVDPTASPSMRHNRSAGARSALFRMRCWLEDELDQPVCSLI